MATWGTKAQQTAPAGTTNSPLGMGLVPPSGAYAPGGPVTLQTGGGGTETVNPTEWSNIANLFASSSKQPSQDPTTAALLAAIGQLGQNQTQPIDPTVTTASGGTLSAKKGNELALFKLQQQLGLMNEQGPIMQQEQQDQMAALNQQLSYGQQQFQNSMDYLKNQYQNSLFGLNTGATASGAYGSVGANQGRSQLSTTLGSNQQQLQEQLSNLQTVGGLKRDELTGKATLSNDTLAKNKNMNLAEQFKLIGW